MWAAALGKPGRYLVDVPGRTRNKLFPPSQPLLDATHVEHPSPNFSSLTKRSFAWSFWLQGPLLHDFMLCGKQDLLMSG